MLSAEGFVTLEASNAADAYALATIHRPEVIVMDAATRQEIKRIDVGGGAAGIQMAPDGSRAFAAVGSQNGVAIIDLKTLQVTGRIATGPGPDGLAWVAGSQ